MQRAVQGWRNARLTPKKSQTSIDQTVAQAVCIKGRDSITIKTRDRKISNEKNVSAHKERHEHHTIQELKIPSLCA